MALFFSAHQQIGVKSHAWNQTCHSLLNVSFNMHTMISNASLPPYNRFDRVPRHALQCGLPQQNEHDHQPHHHHHYKHHLDKNSINDILHGHHNSAMRTYPNNSPAADMQLRSKLDSTGSRNSVASTISSISQESMRNGTQSSNSSSEKILASQTSLDSLLSPTSPQGDNPNLLNRLQQELYIEKSPPPPYNGKHRIVPDTPPNRTELPKKSQAAQQRIAELLKESDKPAVSENHSPFGKLLYHLHWNFGYEPKFIDVFEVCLCYRTVKSVTKTKEKGFFLDKVKTV